MRYVDNLFSLDRPGIGILFIYMSVEGLVFFILTLFIEVRVSKLYSVTLYFSRVMALAFSN